MSVSEILEFKSVLREFLKANYRGARRKVFEEQLSEFSRGEQMQLPKSYLTEFLRPEETQRAKHPHQGMEIIKKYLRSLGYECDANGIVYKGDDHPAERYQNTIEGKYALVFDNGGNLDGYRRFSTRRAVFPTDETKYRKIGSYTRKLADFTRTTDEKYTGEISYRLHSGEPSYATLQLTENEPFPPIGTYYLKRRVSALRQFHVWYGIGLGLYDFKSNQIIAAPAIMLPESDFGRIWPFFSICAKSQNNTPLNENVVRAIQQIFKNLPDPQSDGRLFAADNFENGSQRDDIMMLFDELHKELTRLTR